jgi:uncharacterized protein (TIGR00369 family)
MNNNDVEKIMNEKTGRNHPTYLPTYDGCYVCGQNHSRGLRARFFIGDEGQVHAHFKPDHTQTSYENIVHGGVISALLDEILGWPIALQTDRMCFTGELTVRFLKPMLPGNTYLVTAYPGTEQGKYWEGKGDVRDEHGQIYAKARGKYFFLSDEQAAAVAVKLTYQDDDLLIFRDRRQIEESEG